MLRFPNCKINLGLYVTNRRPDGYHDLETVFYPVMLRDALEVVPAESGKTELFLSGRQVAGDCKDNLVWKAYELLKQKFRGKVPALDVYLYKAIPMGAGLGGGSADAAFMLRLLNDYCHLGLAKQELIDMALQLGSDCPFFIENTPQFATGRGELMSPVPVDLSGYSIQLVCPDVHVSTAKAFGMITPRSSAFDLRMLAELPVTEWKDKVSNDFEAAVFQQHPELENIKQQLYTSGAIYASMSGSGSAVYGIFAKGKKAHIVSSLKYDNFYIE